MAIEILVSSKQNDHKEWIIVENYSNLAELEEECREVGPDFVIKDYEPRLNQIEIVNPEMAWYLNESVLRAERDGNLDVFSEYINAFGDVDYDKHLKTFVGEFDTCDDAAQFIYEKKGISVDENVEWEAEWNNIEDHYLVKVADIRDGNQGKRHLYMTLADATGEIQAVKWSLNPSEVSTFTRIKPGMIIGVRGSEMDENEEKPGTTSKNKAFFGVRARDNVCRPA